MKISFLDRCNMKGKFMRKEWFEYQRKQYLEAHRTDQIETHKDKARFMLSVAGTPLLVALQLFKHSLFKKSIPWRPKYRLFNAMPVLPVAIFHRRTQNMEFPSTYIAFMIICGTAGSLFKSEVSLLEDYISAGVNDIPDPTDTALMARFIVHNSDWTSVSYISNDSETEGLPLAALFSVSDGPKENGTGIPYFYVSELQAAVASLVKSNHNCSLMMSLAQNFICRGKKLDPQDPRCAHVVLTGIFHRINNSSAEYEAAKEAVFVRHPTFINLPENHHFFFAKLNITHIIVQDMFGGPSIVPVPSYFKVHNELRSLSQTSFSSSSVKNNLLIFNLLIGLIHLLI